MKKTILIIGSIAIIILIVVGFYFYAIKSPLVGDGVEVSILKVKENNDGFIPVALSEDRSKITAFKGPGDLYNYYLAIGNFPEPIKLESDFYFNFVFGESTVFLNIPYTDWVDVDNFEYKPAPSTNIMYKMIKDKEPFSEGYKCTVYSVDEESLFHGISKSQLRSLEKELNEIIENNQISERCRKII